MSDGTTELETAEELNASWAGPAATEPPEDHLERLLRSLDDRRPEPPARCDGHTPCGDWPW